MTNAFSCICTERQLEQVGCDCIASRVRVGRATVFVWGDGYASDNRHAFKIDVGTPRVEIEAEAQRIFGFRAKVYDVRQPESFGPHRPISEAYRRAMSNDNS